MYYVVEHNVLYHIWGPKGGEDERARTFICFVGFCCFDGGNVTGLQYRLNRDESGNACSRLYVHPCYYSSADQNAKANGHTYPDGYTKCSGHPGTSRGAG